jgi:transposase
MMASTAVIISVERRRRWPPAEKEQLVAASLEPGASVSEVARSAGLHVSQLFKWRKSRSTSSRPVGWWIPITAVTSVTSPVSHGSNPLSLRQLREVRHEKQHQENHGIAPSNVEIGEAALLALSQ